MKEIITYKIDANGFTVDAVYYKEDVEQVFLPLLRAFTRLREQKKDKVLILLAAAPGTGKTTLVQFLEQLSEVTAGIDKIKSIGLDGFHYPAAYLKEHFAELDGMRTCLADIKGAAETFDLNKLKQKISEVKTGETLWPVYDRTIHDVSDRGAYVNSEIILLEGNWLLLNRGGWEDLEGMCDLSIMVRAEEKLLKKRLMDRKIRGGFTSEQACVWYENSDRKNVRSVLEESLRADIEIEMTSDGAYRITGGRGVLL